MGNFIAYQIAMEAARSLGGCLGAIRKKDRDLDRQMRRATQSIVLNLAEGNRRRGQDRLHLFRVAAGSAAEVMAALELAVAWGYLSEAQSAPARQLLDRLLAVCWGLTERGKPAGGKARGK
jgi:four helix bundle protein